MVRHSPYAIEHTSLCPTKPQNISIKFLLMGLNNDRTAAMRTENDMIDEVGIAHDDWV